MHRQSLSSPCLKLHGHGGAKEEKDTVDEPKLRDSASSASIFDEDDDDNAGKSRRASSAPSRTAKFIHLIPIFIFCCFLVLYLCSHTPSASEMDSFRGFKGSSKLSDSAVNLDGFRRFPAVLADVLPIRTVKNLQEIRPHRKLADF